MRERRGEERSRSAWDFAAQTLLITDIFRGMWMTLVGFFKPPYTIYYPYEKGKAVRDRGEKRRGEERRGEERRGEERRGEERRGE